MRVENPMLACYSGTCTDAAGLGWHNPNCWVGPSEIVARQDDEVECSTESTCYGTRTRICNSTGIQYWYSGISRRETAWRRRRGTRSKD